MERLENDRVSLIVFLQLFFQLIVIFKDLIKCKDFLVLDLILDITDSKDNPCGMGAHTISFPCMSASFLSMDLHRSSICASNRAKILAL